MGLLRAPCLRPFFSIPTSSTMTNVTKYLSRTVIESQQRHSVSSSPSLDVSGWGKEAWGINSSKMSKLVSRHWSWSASGSETVKTVVSILFNVRVFVCQSVSMATCVCG